MELMELSTVELDTMADAQVLPAREALGGVNIVCVTACNSSLAANGAWLSVCSTQVSCSSACQTIVVL